MLARLGVVTVRDLLFFFPRDYLDLSDLRPIANLEEGAMQTVVAEVVEVDSRTSRGGRSVLGVLLKQEDQYLRALWYNQPFLQKKFHQGQVLRLSGKTRMHGGRWEMAHPHVQDLDGQPGAAEQLLPVYPLTEGLQQRHVRRLVETAVETCVADLDEVFPADYLASHDLLPIHQALRAIHFPPDRVQLEAARRRFIYQELFVLQLALAYSRQQTRAVPAAAVLPADARIDARIRRLFPFALTAGQNQVIAEVAHDMATGHPMNRLLQGDVGSGKTVVALYAMLLAVAHGAQAAIMTPTETLARQHAHTLGDLLAKSSVKLALLTGGAPRRERTEVLAQIASGDAQIVIGTQAMLQADVLFQRLALIVIDEQHKFGVIERARLKQAAEQPHYLVMTATPIPRSVALALYGDLDISSLHEKPPGRQPVHTYLPAPEERPKWWEFVRKKLREGRQAYVIVPLVEGSEKVQAASLDETYESLVNGELEAFRTNLVHGRMETDEKHAAMRAFEEGRSQVLVATSVVEVGINVPNATLMTILGAERFGLAQLHQLRGRVLRGTHPAYCCLFADAETPQAQRRLEAIVDCQDGFRLAEIDFELRGPGDLLGTKQHGMPGMRIADFARDRPVLEEARRDAQAIVAADPNLSAPENASLRRMALVRYGKALSLGDVG